MKRSILLLVGMLSFSILAFSQSIKNDLEYGDQSFEAGNYYNAVKYYLQVFNTFDNPEQTLFPFKGANPLKKNEEFEVYKYVCGRLGESYFNYKDYPEAEIWFAKAVTLEEYKDLQHLSNYGVTLRANQKYEEALVQLKKALYLHNPDFITNPDGVQFEDEKSKAFAEDLQYEIACCEYAMVALKTPTYSNLEKMQATVINEENSSNYAGSDIGENRMLFTSSRFKRKNPTSKRKGAYVNSLMTYNVIDSNMYAIDFGFGLDRHAASASTTEDNQYMYFTSWSEEVEKPAYRIYMARPLNDSLWDRAIPLNSVVNLPESRNIQPFVTRDGKYLYWASNRNEGFGGLDIYYCRLDEYGMPIGRAFNLGPSVNTKRDDQAPFFDEFAQTLYFSSNGRIGMGGLDIFYSDRDGKGWKIAENVGYPINSSKDEGYFSLMKEGNYAYVSSDRSEGCCYELFTTEINRSTICGVVTDAVDESFLEGVNVVLFDEEGNELLTATTDENGLYFFPVIRGREYLITYDKENFLGDELVVSSGTLNYETTNNLPIVSLITTEIDRAVKLKNIFYDYNSYKLRPESELVLDKLARQLVNYPYLVIELGSHTDSKGTEGYNLKLSRQRSQSSVDYLISKGVSKKMLLAKGYGESQPKFRNTNADGSDNPTNRQKNRRTEFKVTRNKMLEGTN
jgi:OOP family OmpA-OmpF porin